MAAPLYSFETRWYANKLNQIVVEEDEFAAKYAEEEFPF